MLNLFYFNLNALLALLLYAARYLPGWHTFFELSDHRSKTFKMKKFFDRSWATLYSWNKNREAVIYGPHGSEPCLCRGWQHSQYSDLLRAWRSGDRIPVEARFSTSVQTGPGAHPAFYTMGTGSFLGVKRPGRGVDHPPTSSAEVREREKLYFYSPFGPLWPVLGWTLRLLYAIPIPRVNSLQLNSLKKNNNNSQRPEMYIFFEAPRAILGPTQPPTQWKTAYVLLGIERPGRESDHSPQFSVEIKDDWSYRVHIFQRNKF